MIKRSLFLDLEGTIIESMDNPMILENIREEWFTRLIAEADEIHMFSWAITSDADIASSLWLIRHVEETMGIKFASIVKRVLNCTKKTMQNYANLCKIEHDSLTIIGLNISR